MELKIEIPDNVFKDILESFPITENADITESVLFSLEMSLLKKMKEDYVHFESVLNWVNSEEISKKCTIHFKKMVNAYDFGSNPITKETDNA